MMIVAQTGMAPAALVKQPAAPAAAGAQPAGKSMQDQTIENLKLLVSNLDPAAKETFWTNLGQWATKHVQQQQQQQPSQQQSQGQLGQGAQGQGAQQRAPQANPNFQVQFDQLA